MKPHPRIRTAIKWGGAAVTVLLVVVWVGSGWRAAGWSGGMSDKWSIGSGQLIAESGRGLPPYFSTIGLRGWWSTTSPYSLHWGFQRKVSWYVPSGTNGSSPVVMRYWLPLWPLVAALFLVTVAAWRLDSLARRRVRVHLCPKCHYDRAGLAASAKCPECGAAA